MLNFIISLIITSQLVVPIQGLISTISINSDLGYPKRKITESFEPIIEANAAIVVDVKSEKILYQKNGFQKRPIASITKLMTALVFLDTGPNWDKNIEITQDDRDNGGNIQLLPGEIVNVKDLFNAALIGSVNNAAYELAYATKLSYQDFIKKMNSKAQELNMENTSFEEPTGINSNNQSTAKDVAILLKTALSNPLIKKALSTTQYNFTAINGKRHYIKNTNILLKSYLHIIGGKTGYIDEAGYCLANLVVNKEAQDGIIVVILGAKSKEDRFQQSKFLTQWVFDNWSWGNTDN